MIVNRVTFNTKMGKEEKAVELLKEGLAIGPPVHGMRIYTNRFGSMSKLISEIEFETLAEQEKFWEKLYSSPEVQDWLERWFEVVDPGGSNEIYNLVD